MTGPGSLTTALFAAAFLTVTNAQIPTVCTDQNSLENLICCPVTAGGICGEDANRGSCVSLDFPNYDNETSDVRVNWPHYYTQICQCNGNFGGYDCSRCDFGYYGPDCSQFQVLPRPPVRDLTDEDWADFIDILKTTRTFDSGYRAVLEESLPGNASIPTLSLTLYEYYVWVHHYTAKDSLDPVRPVDYSHTGPGFFTWHRMLNLHFEWQIQGMLQNMGREDYHTFRLPYWDWRIEMQLSSIGVRSEELFTENRLGATRNVGGFPRVVGTLFEDWDTICWLQPTVICDRRVSTGPLQRCPFTGTNPCSSSNPDWPTNQDIQNALSFDVYDVPNYDIFSFDGFRSFIDANVTLDVELCRADRMCECIPGGVNCDPIEGVITPALFWQFHARVHFIPGVGDVVSRESLADNMKGQMEDTAASPNDPLFIVHHTMVDCVLEEYLRAHPDTEYPVAAEVRDGHKRDDYIRGFFPLRTNGELFQFTQEFGYSCRLGEIPDAAIRSISSPLLLLLATILTTFVVAVV